MFKKYKKNIIALGIAAILLFSWFWNEGFGIFPRYEYGSTAEKALNFWYSRGLSFVGLSKVLAEVDLNNNEKLVFFKNTANLLSCGLVKKKWNNKWIVIQQGGGVPFNAEVDSNNNNKALGWQWHNMDEFGLSFGVSYNPSVYKIKVGNENATILTAENIRIWYFIDKNGSSKTDFKPNLDMKAYDLSDKLIYSYYPQ